jgi:hypothetical protein
VRALASFSLSTPKEKKPTTALFFWPGLAQEKRKAGKNAPRGGFWIFAAA